MHKFKTIACNDEVTNLYARSDKVTDSINRYRRLIVQDNDATSGKVLHYFDRIDRLREVRKKITSEIAGILARALGM
jgi:hypothetical protein